MRFVLLICLMLLFPASLFADNGMSCHCFRDRAYNPERPGAADDYLLATTQNSFISGLFDIPKQTIVAAKMSGTDGADLWLAGYVASRTGRTAEQILDLREKFPDWNELLPTLDGFPEWLDPALAGVVFGGKPLAKIVSTLVDLQIGQRLGQNPGTIEKLRQKGATDQELILVATLSRQTGNSAVSLYEQRQKQALPWDMFLYRLGIAPGQIDSILVKLLS